MSSWFLLPLLEEEPLCYYHSFFSVASNPRSSEARSPHRHLFSACSTSPREQPCPVFTSYLGAAKSRALPLRNNTLTQGSSTLNLLSWSSSCSSMFSTYPELMPLDLKQDASAVLLLHHLCLS